MKLSTPEERNRLARAVALRYVTAATLPQATAAVEAAVLDAAGVDRHRRNVIAIADTLLAALEQLAATRAAIAAHVAAVDEGDDPTTAGLLADLDRHGCALDDDEITAARALHTAQAVAW